MSLLGLLPKPTFGYKIGLIMLACVAAGNWLELDAAELVCLVRLDLDSGARTYHAQTAAK